MGGLAGTEMLAGALRARQAAGAALGADAAVLADAAYAMAARFHRGGKLMAFGPGGDPSHVAVEFMHPVIVGKPALPALALSNDPAGVAHPSLVYAHQLSCFGDAADIALGLSADGVSAGVRTGLARARDLGLLTVALVGGDGAAAAGPADYVFVARAQDPGVVSEIHVTTYHLMWELVHVLLERPGVLGPRVFA